MKLLQNKVAIITGASRGIGKGIAIKFAEQGCNIAFTYLSSVEKALAFEKELAAFGIKAKGYQSDAADFKAADQLVIDVVAEFGTVDILVNNAGLAGFFCFVQLRRLHLHSRKIRRQQSEF